MEESLFEPGMVAPFTYSKHSRSCGGKILRSRPAELQRENPHDVKMKGWVAGKEPATRLRKELSSRACSE